MRCDRVALAAASGCAVPRHDELDGGKLPLTPRQLWGLDAKQQFLPCHEYCSSGRLREGRRACGQEATLHECHQRASQRRLREKMECGLCGRTSQAGGVAGATHGRDCFRLDSLDKVRKIAREIEFSALIQVSAWTRILCESYCINMLGVWGFFKHVQHAFNTFLLFLSRVYRCFPSNGKP